LRSRSRSILRTVLTALPVLVLSTLAQAADLPAGASVQDLARAAERMGYSPEQIRSAAATNGMEAVLRPPPAPAARYDSSALAPRESRPDSAAPAPAPRPDAAPEPFGTEIFRYSPSTFEPLAYGPVAPDYPVGPGDELVITMWGDAQLALTLVVNREGAITLPDVGTVVVSGLTLDGTRARIRAALSRAYAGLRPATEHSTIGLDVSLGRLRSIQVFLLGEVVRPGGYTISSVSRALNALYVAGGATRQGSLRDVRVMRGGRRVASVDLYRLLLEGDAGDSTRLQNGDVVFVPTAGRRVRADGPLRRPGLFELKEGEDLRALMRFSGGPLADADLARAQIERVVPPALRDSLRGQDRLAVDVPLARLTDPGAADVPLCDADHLVLFRIGDERHNVVHVSGLSVMKPGVYEYRPGMKVSDLVAAAGGLKPEAWLERAQVTRTALDRTRSVLRVDLGPALAGEAAADLALEPLDELDVMSKWDVTERGTVTIQGMVRRPGTVEFLEGMTLADLIYRAGGLTDDALPVYAELARLHPNATDQRIADTLRVPIDRVLSAGSPASAFRLEPWDAVFVRRDPQHREQVFVAVSGEVRFPGRYALTRRDERLADLVRRAGGLTEYAYAQASSFARAGAPRLGIDLPAALRNPHSASNLVLEGGDELSIARFEPVVRIEGAVFNPSAALYRPGAGVGFYVTQANGYRSDADRRRVTVVQANGTVQKGGRPGPGSRVIVPAKPPEPEKDHLKDFATLMGILASAATTAYLVQQASK
jgi:polysaccharide biosynthesis/export protein